MKIWWSRVISNEMLWEMTGQININKEIIKRKFGWIGHTLRKDDNEPCKAALQWNPQGTRGRGSRPRNSWRRTTLNECGKHSWSDLRFIVRNREGWRRFVDKGDRGSIPGGGKGFFLYPLCPDRLWGPPSLLYNGYRGSFPRG
jgi:hypothetical protein